MINIIKDKNPLIAQLLERLNTKQIDYQMVNWDHIDFEDLGLNLVILGSSAPQEFQDLVNLTHSRKPALILHEEPMAEVLKQITNEYVLKLPLTLKFEITFEIILWILKILKKYESDPAHINLHENELKQTNIDLQTQALDLKRALEELDSRNKQITKELMLASELQMSLIPKSFPDGIPIAFAHKYLPYAYIGGDIFEVIRLEKHKIGFIIADVSGHGVAAAFITAMFKTAFNYHVKENYQPVSVFNALNAEFSHTLSTEHYITAFYIVIDVQAKTCTFSNAGHPFQLLVKKSGEIVELDTEGFFIGMFENTEYHQKTLSLNKRDRLVFYTDGVVEVVNDQGVQYGREGLKKILLGSSGLGINDLSNTILSDLMMYMKEPVFPDDITLIILELLK